MNWRFLVKRIKFFKENWKLGVHLIFRTKRFGVNNQKWSTFDSMFGVSTRQIWSDIFKIKPILMNWKRMKFRAKAAYFLTDEEYELTFNEKRYPEKEKENGSD